MSQKTFFVALFALVLTTAGLFTSSASANHTWGNYHWARTANPFTLKLGDNVTSKWDASLLIASTDWSLSSVLDTTIVLGATNPKNCKAVSGRVEVCNSKYGNNGWLGIASIWANGAHITQGTVKLNDTYFNTAKYNTPAWKQLVICQEVAHTFGLDHQDENFTNPNLGTCMDYTNDPSTNQHPNQHDYDMLETMYAHLDSGTTASQTPSSNRQEVDHSDPSAWGKQIRTSSDGHGALYERDLGKGNKIFTFVIWAN
ncbi:MAG TPA: hypothetical protein VJJ24_00240 [Candidatus Paceibacterota bacterium]